MGMSNTRSLREIELKDGVQRRLLLEVQTRSLREIV
ncbi:hypothetical protein BVRB_5g099160 [Beta vulgaris subsp. vulgaris]|nr:hypothetical protein BVRB_5g099160 [Beta vulgaris subsp. vulgaris]